MDANLNLIRGFSFFSFFPPTLRRTDHAYPLAVLPVNTRVKQDGIKKMEGRGGGGGGGSIEEAVN